MLENAVVFAAKRVMSVRKETYTNADLTTLTFADVKNATEKLTKGYGAEKKSQRRIGFIS